jgi:hypothetical protein
MVAVEIIDAHNAPITTFFQSKKDESSGQQILLPQSPTPPEDRPLSFGGGPGTKKEKPQYAKCSKIGQRPKRLGCQQARSLWASYKTRIIKLKVRPTTQCATEALTDSP